jgi:ATP-dependent RNA helicase SUPV3L1/SUV3
MPLMLKPAPTRLRLVLWSLANGLDVFPEAPPPGLVTVPNVGNVPEQHYTLAGYRKAGQRAIRIDMLERLADMLRAEDSRGGFEAKADMLSITGMTLEQFADLMTGLGYRAEPGERSKVKPADAVLLAETGEQVEGEATQLPEDTPVMDVAAETAPALEPGAEDTPPPADVAEPVAALEDEGEAPISAEPAEQTDEASNEAVVPETPEEEILPGTAPDEALAGAEMEVFYTFTWGGNRGGNRGGQRRGAGGGKGRRDAAGGDRGPRGDRDQRGGGGKGKGPKGKGGGKGPKGDRGPKSFESRPPRKEKQIDPDNPFAAALMGLKDRS